MLLSAAPTALAAGTATSAPPAPPRYFNDYARVVDAGTAQQLNQQLENFEKATSSQILVVIYPELPAGAALEDYTIRAASTWKVGQKAKDNGAILFVFIRDRRMRIEVGYGLEGALPDALAKRIIEDEIKPHFQAGDYAGGLTAGVSAMMQATRGEYQGTGRTAAGRRPQGGARWVPLLVFLVLLILLSRRFRRRSTMYSPWGRSSMWGGWGGGGWSGGGWSGGGGGGMFSGGGGGFGGGGASGSW